MEFSHRLKQLRNEKGITQSQLAVEFGKGEGAVRMWETGKAKPDCDTLIKLAKYFGCTTDYLLGISESRYMSTSDNEAYNEQKIRNLEAKTAMLYEKLKMINDISEATNDKTTKYYNTASKEEM